ncbi:IPT/TIG domain-containing protein, partial [Candidatus Parcubacteria bacterium]|nr:IPT/TIG domain-containing protein [Candidatus Parcubacteria bacterium]
MTKSKRILASILAVTTILWSIGPSLVLALPVLEVTNVVVSTSSIEITFGDDVLSTTLKAAEELGAATKSAGDLRNYLFKVGSPLATKILSRGAPYSMTTEYFTAENKMRIYGVENLYLTTGDNWTLSIPASTIQHATSTDVFVAPFGPPHAKASGTVVGVQDPVISYIKNSSEPALPTGCYSYPCGAIGSTIEIHGSNYTTSTKANFHFDNTGTLVNTTFVSAEKLTAVIPAGVGPGKVIVQTQDPNTGRFSNDRNIVVWDSTIGVVVGSLTLADTTTGVKGAEVTVDMPSYWGSGSSSYTHANGYYAVPVTLAGTYEAR